ncbi:MAG: hypothetical protein EHM61_14705 [Acidobacteria bacterium]|nr:MAG: hypothetical protein EHM61_14705 [Acidobacteriota bacterium]
MVENHKRSFLRASLLVLLGLITIAFVAVAAEVSMTPPPLAPRRNPAGNYAGEWKGTVRVTMPDQRELALPLHLNIRSDGTVQGSIGQARVKARFEWNRSWLGRALHLRSDYIITGQVSGFSGGPAAGQNETLSIPLAPETSYLRGAVFIGKRGPSRISLFLVRRQESSGSRRLLESL